MAITAAGTGSGIDIESLITGLMTAEKIPLTKLTTKETALQSKISLIGQFKSLISNLQTSASNLQNLGKINGVTATVGDSSALTVTAGNKAVSANYSLDVLQLAKSQSITSSAGTFTSTTQALVDSASGVSTAKISINFGSVTTVTDETTGTTSSSFTADSSRLQEISIAVGDDGEISLQDVADAINGGDYGVTASLIKDKTTGSVRLSLSSDDTGADNAFKLDVSYLNAAGDTITPDTTPDLSKLAFDPAATDANASMASTIAASDSRFTLNGLEISRSSNTIDDAVTGLSFTLKATTSASTTLTVARDSSAISTQLQSFVDAYNKIASAIKSTTSYDSTTKVAGALQGDATIRGLQNQLRSLMTGTFGDGTNSTNTLSSLGVSFQQDGTLVLDSTKLDTAVSSDLDGVLEFFGSFDQTLTTVAPSTSYDGFAYKMYQLTKSMLADDGLIDAKIDSLNSSVDSIDTQRERINLRLESIEKVYRAKFTAMDSAVASMQNLSSYITQLFESTSSS